MNRYVISSSSFFDCCCILGVCGAALLNNLSPAIGLECLNHPDAIGTGRTIVVDPKQTPRVGDLTLKDHEIVVTFDDGPLPQHTEKILDSLAAECVKAQFFVVGDMARDAPDLVRRLVREGHTVGTHTQTHAHLGAIPISDAANEIETAIAAVAGALQAPQALAPFFRAPYLETTPAVEHYVRMRGLMMWGIDFDADDWLDITPEEVVSRALAAIENKGKGVLLLHDIQDRTAIALPILLKELKKRRYQIVHIVPSEGSAIEPRLPPEVAHEIGKVAIAKSQYQAKSPDTSCGDNPSAIGTSRTIEVDPAALPQVGTVQFPKTLPLGEHELVLTFDDGPLPPFTNQIIDTLASQCVKATFFVVGDMVNDSPEIVRRLVSSGHTVGTMTQTHADLSKLRPAEAVKEIDSGINSATAALGDAHALAPFFRDPYLNISQEVGAHLLSRGLMLWSIDFQADDWRDISPDDVVSRAIEEIEKKGRGILELYDIQERTALALPKLLAELKRREYRIVHVVPAAPGAMGVQRTLDSK
jgi:peptidoglycan/xylan/chitin deacetylase (PgdA/CDA1 family)